MHPQIITDPPPCFTIWWTCWGPTRSLSPIQHYDLRYELQPICLCLVTKKHAFPIIIGPILIPLSKPHACENIARRLARAHYSGNFASINIASKLHQSLVLLFMRQWRHTTTNNSTNCTSRTMKPRLHNAQEISQCSRLWNAQRCQCWKSGGEEKRVL